MFVPCSRFLLNRIGGGSAICCAAGSVRSELALELVESRVEAQRRLYSLRPEPLREIDAWIEPYRRLWGSSLDALEVHLDEMSY